MTVTASPFTLRSVLFGDDDAGSALREALSDSDPVGAVIGAIPELSAGLRRAAGDEVAGVISGFLDLDLSDMAIAAWRKHSALADAARRTLSGPGEELVELATHRITSVFQPVVDVEVDDVKVAEIEVEITVTIKVHGLIAVVEDGRLVGLRSGQADIACELKCEGAPLASARRRIDLSFAVRLGSGIVLVTPASIPAPPAVPTA